MVKSRALAAGGAQPPKIQLTRDQWIRMIVVGIFAAFSLARVVPDAARLIYPLGQFNYITSGDAVVVSATARGARDIRAGDRVRVDRIQPFDRKPGLVRVPYTYDNYDRHLPVERDGTVRILDAKAHAEDVVGRITALVRIVIYVFSVLLGGLLFLMKPGLLTGAFFVFALGGEYPTTFSDLWLTPYPPWRELPALIGNTLRGAAIPACLLFALCLLLESRTQRRIAAGACVALGLAVGALHAYSNWLMVYAGAPAQRLDTVYGDTTAALTVLTLVVFTVRFARVGDAQRTPAAVILAAFVIAGIARIVTAGLFPAHLNPWIYGLLQTTPIVPIVAVWFAVVRHSFFNVDFVVSRGVVFAALTAAMLGFVASAEELATYLFYNNANFAYVVFSAMGLAFGASFSRVRNFLNGLVDRLIFRDRLSQRVALELIGGYILDAESAEDVYRALLEDAPHALKLSFGGILTRRENGGFELTRKNQWPDDLDVRLEADDALTREIIGRRSGMTFSGKESGMIRRAFPAGRLTFAAPIFSDRRVGEIVVYGHNVSGLDIDPEERELLVRVVEHATIALREIELARYRKTVAELVKESRGSVFAEVERHGFAET
jgi:hypothetical protein